MQVKRIAECSKGGILQAILSTLIKLPSFTKTFVLSVLSGHLGQILLFFFLSGLTTN